MKDFKQELELAVFLARKAGAAVLDYYGGKLDIKDKGGDSPLTKADLASDKILQEGFKKTGYGILSEEGADNKERLKKELVWVIDPLDGTKDFIQQTGEFTIMAGLVQIDKGNNYLPVLGVICRPVADTLYFAVKGQGAYKMENGEIINRIKVSPETKGRNLVMLTSRNHTSELERQVAINMGIAKIISLGSSLKACQVAEGKGHVNFNPSAKTWEWDVCASDIIISEAGGKFTDCQGNTITYNKKDPRNKQGYLATNGLLHEEVAEKIKKAV